jgi:hypothetical protein
MVVCVVFMVILINKNEEVISPKVLTVDTYYSFLDQEGELIYIDLYLSTQMHPLTKLDSYSQIILHDESYDKSLNMSLNNVLFRHQETYLNDTYYKYTYALNTPLLGHDFDILECFMNVELVNGDAYDFYMGSFSLKTAIDDSEHLSWTELSGMKKPGSYLSRLDEVTISFDTLDEHIEHISFGNIYELSFEVIGNEIKIDIPYQAQLFNACPIMIRFSDQEVEVFNYFVFINDYEILKQSGQLIYHYALD